MDEPIRVFVGTEPKTLLMERVLEHSIRTRTRSSVAITSMIGSWWEYPTDGIQVGTGFSLRRWLIPEFCNWQGRAIYLDADQLCLADITELWAVPHDLKSPTGTSCWMTFQPDKFSTKPWPQSSVMVIDCQAAKPQWMWHRDKMLAWLKANGTKDKYAAFMHAADMQPQPVEIPIEWNHLNVHVPKGRPNATKLIHYTKEPQQPIYEPNHPLAELWQKELEATIACGAISKSEFEDALSRWKVKEDWRNQNGLHPYYRRFLSLFPSR